MKPRTRFALAILGVLLTCGTAIAEVPATGSVQIGPRPLFLVDQLDEGVFKQDLARCADRTETYQKTDFSIGHRGACMQFPEHTEESYIAAAQQGAGIVECDVTFTKDGELVCRHSQCDLHTTTDILATPLASTCREAFTPATFDPVTGERVTTASAKCCTSEITAAEFKTLKGKMDASNPDATTVEEYLGGTANWRTDLYSGPSSGTVMTHAESVDLFKALGVGVTPELKSPDSETPMPFDTDGDGAGDFSYDDYRQKLIDELRAGGVNPRRAWVQSFVREDIDYWIAMEPEFGEQAVYLIPADDNDQLAPFFDELDTYKGSGINYVAPAMWALVEEVDGKIVPSPYATKAKEVGLKIITWTLERSGILADGDGGYYYQRLNGTDALTGNEGDILRVLDVLAQEVEIEGIFSDWPATTTFYGNCKAIPALEAGNLPASDNVPYWYQDLDNPFFNFKRH